MIARLDLKEPEPLYNRGSQFYSLCRRPEAALADFARVIAMAPAWADAYSERGRILMLERRNTEALADHDKAVELAPKWADAILSRSEAHIALEQWQETLADFDRYFGLGAEGEYARFSQARALVHLGRDEEALAATGKTIQALPRRVTGYYNRAFVLFWLGRVDEAIASLDKAIEVQPTNWGPYISRAGISCYKPAPCGTIVADLEKAEALGGPSPGVWRGLAWAQVADLWGTCPSDVNLAKALDLARRAVGAVPNNSAFQYALGVALYRSGKHEEARAALLAGLAVELPSSDGTVPALCTLAMSEWKLGRKDEARATYARALDRLKRGFPKSPLNIKFQLEAAGLLGMGT